MSRPVYETQYDRQREAEVAAHVESVWKAKCLMMPKFSAADMLILDGQNNPKCWVEIKSRNIIFGQYQNMHIAVEKILRLQELIKLTKLPAIIIANLQDGIFWHHCPQTETEIVKDMGGRTDRNDPQDVGVMACFNWNDFEELK